MKPNDQVKMTEEFKQELINNGCSDHIEEFGDCLGIIDSWEETVSCWNVRWQPSNLRYCYLEKDLNLIKGS